MFEADPRYATFPHEPGVEQLRWFIQEVAAQRLPVSELLQHFRATHEAIERLGRPRYRSKDEARLVWDVLWALEFYSPDPTQEKFPAEWNSADMVLAEVQRAAAHMAEL